MATDSKIQEIIPNPDPSALTSTSIDRAVTNAFRITEAKLTAIDVRIDGMEKAVEVFQADLTRVPTQLDRAIDGLRDVIDAEMRGSIKEIEKLDAVTDQRFIAVGAQFTERDTRTDQRACDTQKAVDAAFAAAKESIAEIKANFTKQIDGLITILDSKTGNLANSLADLKERVVSIESRTAGISIANLDQRAGRVESHNQQIDSRGNMAVIISIMAVVASALFHFLK
jgi:hypothetical protein